MPTPTDPAELAARALLTGTEAFGSALLVLAVDRYGAACLDWHPRSLRRQLEEDHAVTLSETALQRLLAARAVQTTDFFFQNLRRFLILAEVLAGNGFDPAVVALPDAAECAWAITEALLLSPPGPGEAEHYFCGDVRHYLRLLLRAEGFTRPPDVLRLAAAGDAPAAAAGAADARADYVNASLRRCLGELGAQLRSLPLRRGSAAEICQRIERLLAGPPAP